jgi:hypothetical protein
MISSLFGDGVDGGVAKHGCARHEAGHYRSSTGLRYSKDMNCSDFTRRWSGLAALLLAGAVAASPTPPGAQIEIFPPVPDAGTRVRYEVRGEWPDACVPELDSIRVEDREIVLHAMLPAARCVGEARPFVLSSDSLPGAPQKIVANGIHHVRFEVSRSPGAEPELHGFRLLYAGNNPDPEFVPETGFWWPERGGNFDRGGPGIGMQLEVQASILSMSVFGYAEQGAATWYFGAGALTGHTAHIPLSVLQGGAGPFEAYAAPKSIDPAGSVLLELLSPSRVVMWFVRAAPNGRGLLREPMSMVRFRFSASAESWLGRWVLIAEEGDAAPTRRIDFVRVERHGDDFALVDASGSHRLSCDVDPGRPNSPPAACRLVTSGSTELDVDFSDIALNELRGWNGSGERIVALKLNR